MSASGKVDGRTREGRGGRALAPGATVLELRPPPCGEPRDLGADAEIWYLAAYRVQRAELGPPGVEP